MSLHEAIGALVGGGIGANRIGVEREMAAESLEVISDVVARGPSSLADALAERLEPGGIRESAVLGATDGVSGLALWDRLTCSREGPFADRELVEMAVAAARGRPDVDGSGWPFAERLIPYYLRTWQPTGFNIVLPHDPGIVVGDVAALASISADAVVSLCRMGSEDVPPDIDHVEAWLVDEDNPAANPNLAFVLRDAATTIIRLRDEGKRLFVHCVRAESRTPAVTAVYLALRLSLSGSQALAITDSLIPGPGPKRVFRDAITQLFASPGAEAPT